MYHSFEDLVIWKKSLALTKELVNFLKLNFKSYHPLADQILRSAISIPSNIAEGCERKTDTEFARFLYISRGSCAELRTQLEIAKEFLENVHESEINSFINEAKELSKMIYGLIKTLDSYKGDKIS